MHCTMYCYSNCPRVYPPQEDRRHGEDSTEATSGPAAAALQLPAEFQTDAGRRLFPDRAKPCYLLFRLTRPHCRALRNHIITNSSKLSVVKGNFCGIATQVFNLRSNYLEPTLSMGLLRFGSTDQAHRFVLGDPKMGRGDFLGGRFDIWNLTLAAPDRSIAPNPLQPSKFVSALCVFHFVHVQALALLPEGTEMSPEARNSAIERSSLIQSRMEAQLETVAGHDGRLVVKATTAARLRGLPHHSPLGEPRLAVYMTQWPGVHQFWQWFEGPDGTEFSRGLDELTGGGFESLLFTACLDFIDIS